MRHCWHWCGFTSGRPPIPSLPSCIAVLVIRYCATTGISRLSSYSYREYIRLICICVLLFLLSYFLSRPDYPDIRAFYGSPSQYNESDCSLQYCSMYDHQTCQAQDPGLGVGGGMCHVAVSAPRLSQCGPSPPSDAHSADRVNNLQPVQCCSAAVLQCCRPGHCSQLCLARPAPAT